MSASNFVCTLSAKPLHKKRYLLHAASQWPFLVVAGASPDIAVLHVETQQSVLLKGHEDDVVGLCFDPQLPMHVWSASRDGTVRCWSIEAQSCVRVTQVSEGSTPCSFALSSDGACFAVGCEQSAMREAPVFVFAAGLEGANEPLVSLTDCHSDDVMHIAASDGTAASIGGETLHRFATASTDGLCNIIDADACLELARKRAIAAEGVGGDAGGTAGLDDDAVVVVTINTDHSVKRVGFFGAAQEYVFCISHDETLSFWSVPDPSQMDTGDDLADDDDDEQEDLAFRLDDPRGLLTAAGAPTDYVVDCFYDRDSGRLYLASGTDEGSVLISHVGKGELVPLCSLPHKHTDRVRALSWMTQSGTVLATLGEDSRACVFTSA